MSKARQIGTHYETRLVKFFKDVWPEIKRVGSRDFGAGDLEGVPSFVIEAKAESVWGKAKAEKWMRQTWASQQREKKRWHLLLIRWKHKPIGMSLVIMTAEQWKDIVQTYNIK